MAIALDGTPSETDSDPVAAQRGRKQRRSLLTRFSTRPSLTRSYESYKQLFSDLNYTELPDSLGRAESPEPPPITSQSCPLRVTFDCKLVQQTFAALEAAGPAAMEWFYDRLLAANPEMRALFPTLRQRLREHVFDILGTLIRSLDTDPGCSELLAQLGREHRKFGITDRHHQAFWASLRATAEHFIDSDWKPDVAAAWQGALDYFAAVMMQAASADAATSPPWWVAEIVEHDTRGPGVAVLKLAPMQPLPYKAGQYVPVQVTNWPRVWRSFSIANAPRPGGLIELHVRGVPGGLVSNSLVYHSVVGDSVLLGPPAGEMTLTESDRDLLCVAGGTGLAPIKAVIEQAIATSPASKPRNITLYFGARQLFDLYDLQDLQLLAADYPSLRVFPVLSEQPSYNGLTGLLPEVVHKQRSSTFAVSEAYICGPPPMVSQTVEMLSATMPETQIHHDPLSSLQLAGP